MKLCVYGPEVGAPQNFDIAGYTVSLSHVEGDPESVFRLYINSPLGLSLELTPSKGLSLRDCSYDGRQMFWDSPMESLPDPEEVDLLSTVLCDGVAVPGNGWIKYFASHVELLGLKNWGVCRELSEGIRYGLHGNVSNIPVNYVEVYHDENGLHIIGYFDVYGADDIFPVLGKKADYRVEKEVVIPADEPAVYMFDRIVNLSDKTQVPDWGYHIQFKPEENCSLLFPYGSVEERFGENIPDHHNVWESAAVEEVREERGYIYKHLKKEKCYKDGSEGVRVLLKYIDKPGLEAIIPYAPYTMGWFSSGGGNGENFMIPSEQAGGPSSKILLKNWDGVGPEIGASDLDHGGNVDLDAVVSNLAPGDMLVIPFELRFLDQEETDLHEKNIQSYIDSNIS